MNYILRESNDGKYFSLRLDKSGKIVNANKDKNKDIGNEIVFLEGRNTFGTKCKDVWLSSNLNKLIDKGREISDQYGMELKVSDWIKVN